VLVRLPVPAKEVVRPSILQPNQKLHSTQSQAWVPRNVLTSDDGSEPPEVPIKG